MTVAYMDQLTDKVDDIDEKVTSILTLLRGNALDKSDNGIIGAVDSLERRLAILEKWKDRIVWMVLGMGLPASVGIMEILKKIFLK